jgi:hypothetical protein
MVPPALEPDDEPNAAVMELAEMVVPAVPVLATVVLSVGCAWATIISGMDEPQAVVSALLLESPL